MVAAGRDAETGLRAKENGMPEIASAMRRAVGHNQP